jgi:hypothetical protein
MVYNRVVSLIGVREISDDFNKSIRDYFTLISDIAIKKTFCNTSKLDLSINRLNSVTVLEDRGTKAAEIVGRYIKNGDLQLSELQIDHPVCKTESMPLIYAFLSDNYKNLSIPEFCEFLSNKHNEPKLAEELKYFC